MNTLALSTFEKLQTVPRQFWLNAVIAILCIVVIVLIIRRIQEMNKVILAALLVLIFALVGFNWIYERNEPKFLTPFVDGIAPFFPTKGRH
jgi:signal transduction histidine kinase